MRFKALLHAVNDLKADVLSLAITVQPQNEDIRPLSLRSQVVRNEFAGRLLACRCRKQVDGIDRLPVAVLARKVRGEDMARDGSNPDARGLPFEAPVELMHWRRTPC